MAGEKQCICSNCGVTHDFEPVTGPEISHIERLRLFRKTVLEARYITGKVPIPDGGRVGVPYHANDPAALATRYLHVVLYRKYFANRNEKVYLPEVAGSLAAILGQRTPLDLLAKVEADVTALRRLEFSDSAKLFLGAQVSNVTAADVVFDNLYGHLLHADQVRVERAHNLGPIFSTYAAQTWLGRASGLVDKLDRIVEYVFELENLDFDFAKQVSPCPSYK